MATRKPGRGAATSGKPLSAGAGSPWPWLIWSAIVIVLDQFTKTLIVGYYQLGDSTVVTPFFNIVRAHNTGAAFSFLADAGAGNAGPSPPWACWLQASCCGC